MDTCPVCKVTYPQLTARYCNVVCNDCLNRYPCMTEDNKEISFGNIDYTGGFLSVVDGEVTSPPIHKCFMNNIPIYAMEARFGGIVHMGCVSNESVDDNVPH